MQKEEAIDARASQQSIAARVAGLVDADSLQSSIERLARFGARADGGVGREALTPVECEARRALLDEARERGWETYVDDCANLFFRRNGVDDLPPVLTGSHIDTQPAGGRLDGAYGVLAGLEVLRALDRAGVATRRAVEVVAWTNEEGSRFAPGAMGSSAFVDPARLAGYREVRDAERISFGQALDETLAATPDVPRRPLRAPAHCYVELHIEQGPVLEAAGVPVAVVDGIQSVRWFEVRCKGRAAHAGTTPMELRADAMSAALAVASRLQSSAAASAASGLRMTLGRWRVFPNSINTIPGEVAFSIDARCGDEAVLAAFEDALRAAVSDARREWTLGGAITIESLFSRGPTRFASPMLAVMERAVAQACSSDADGAPVHIVSGAFHDAMYLAEYCPTAMLFVPSRAGISHNPAEYTEPAQLVAGARALAHAVTELATAEDQRRSS
ncbi:MAG TPA: M20 family metallo-hydrolase [Paraburkholderia sp.]|jgi:N-carbamoyl-L-amino-acid hydrolase|nr:M20 family metallo-hydrolase [Paraburkholderia sp.]